MDPTAAVCPDELLPYTGQFALPQVGAEGQRRLRDASVLIAGVGGLGCPAALYLAAAGVGSITLADPDHVDRTNLARQVLYGDADCGRPKAEAAREQLLRNNPGIRVTAWSAPLSAANARALIAAHDVVLDCTDNFLARYVINDAALFERRPVVHAAVHRFEGRISIFGAPGGPCYRCLYPEPPAAGDCACAEEGVLGVVPGLLGMLQAGEAIKWITGIGRPLVGRLLMVDLLALEFRELRLARDPGCCACAAPRVTSSPSAHAALPPAPRAFPIAAISPEELRCLLDSGELVQILDLREPHERAGGAIPGSRPATLATLHAAREWFDRSRPLVLYCQTGRRSRGAVPLLREAGFSDVIHLAGGYLAWRIACVPIGANA